MQSPVLSVYRRNYSLALTPADFDYLKAQTFEIEGKGCRLNFQDDGVITYHKEIIEYEDRKPEVSDYTFFFSLVDEDGWLCECLNVIEGTDAHDLLRKLIHSNPIPGRS